MFRTSLRPRRLVARCLPANTVAEPTRVKVGFQNMLSCITERIMTKKTLQNVAPYHVDNVHLCKQVPTILTSTMSERAKLLGISVLYYVQHGVIKSTVH